jgi:DNA processing protein
MTALDKARVARIVLAHATEPGRRDLGELVRSVGPVAALELVRAGNIPPSLLEVVTTRLSTLDPVAYATRVIDLATRIGARIITPEDEEWPPQIDDLVTISSLSGNTIERDTDPPQAIWLRGRPSLREACERAVAVVGSRASTGYGDHVAADLAYGLAERGWSIVSGGAFGIDAAAHRGALAASGLTIAVVAGGIEKAYPPAHHLLFERIAESGLLLSEWPPGTNSHRHRFLVRNRLIAALAAGTVLVEANLRSGARFTLRRTRQLNRMAMVVPGPVTSAMSTGAHEELRAEQPTTLVTRVDQVLEAIGRIGSDLSTRGQAEPAERDELSILQRQVLDGVRPRKILTAEQIAAAVGVPARLVRATMPTLQRAGFVMTEGAGYRLRRPAADNELRHGPS